MKNYTVLKTVLNRQIPSNFSVYNFNHPIFSIIKDDLLHILPENYIVNLYIPSHATSYEEFKTEKRLTIKWYQPYLIDIHISQFTSNIELLKARIKLHDLVLIKLIDNDSNRLMVELIQHTTKYLELVEK